MTNSFKIRKLINASNYYGLIEISGERIQARKLEIEYLDVESEWYSSVECGIKFFYHYFNLSESVGIHVCINRLHTMTGDTTPMTVFFVTVKCLSELFKYPKDLIKLNEENGLYTVVR